MATNRPTLEAVWQRLKDLEGEEFHTKSGKPFTFEIVGNIFRPNRTAYNISRTDFEKALKLVPFDGPGMVNDLIRGPAYVWAVLHDSRVRGNDW